MGGTSDRMSDEEIDAMHDAMIAGEDYMFREVMRGRPGPRLCENSARYNRTRNFEACGPAMGLDE